MRSASAICSIFLSLLSPSFGLNVPAYFNTSRGYVPLVARKLVEREQELILQERLSLTSKLVGVKLLNGEDVLNDKLIMEKGGEPIRNLIVTTWRSGSNFMGEVVSSHPGSFYFSEPLRHLGLEKIRAEDAAMRALDILRQELLCEFPPLVENLSLGPLEFGYGVFPNEFWSHYCFDRPELCADRNFLREMCRLYPIQVVKITRLRLNHAERLLEDPRLNAKILYLLRDPRGTITSRMQMFLNKGDIFSPEDLCGDLVDDFHAATRLQHLYPQRFMAIRYEDVAISPFQSTEKILSLFGLRVDPSVQAFLQSHTVLDIGGYQSTFRNSTETAFHWREELAEDLNLLQDIQQGCVEAMHLWGYVPLLDPTQIRGFNPLMAPPWPAVNPLST